MNKEHLELENEQLKIALKSWQGWWNQHGFDWYVDGGFPQKEKPPILKCTEKVYGMWVKE